MEDGMEGRKRELILCMKQIVLTYDSVKDRERKRFLLWRRREREREKERKEGEK